MTSRLRVGSAATWRRSGCGRSGRSGRARSIPRILESLRPTFAAAADQVTAAIKVGLRPGMTAEDVLELGTRAATAWRALGDNVRVLEAVAAARVALSTVLHIEPWLTPAQEALGQTLDYTACFTDSGVLSGYHGRTGADRWLGLSLESENRLRICDPTETTALLYGTEPSPGWRTAYDCVVKDDEGRPLHLGRGSWLPTWVSSDQVMRLQSDGFLAPAQGDEIRPDDVFPENSPLAPKVAYEPRGLLVRTKRR